MTYIGIVHNGSIVLSPKAHFPDGSKVEIRLIPAGPKKTVPATAGLTEELVQLSQEIRDLPSDLARNHNHYLHGHPRV